MLVATTAERLQEIMDERNMKQVDILELAKPVSQRFHTKSGKPCKIEKNDISQYISGKTKPGNDKLMILSEALDVSPVWLMGFDVNRDGSKKDASESDQSDGRIAECVKLFSQLNDCEKDIIIRQIKGLLSSR